MAAENPSDVISVENPSDVKVEENPTPVEPQHTRKKLETEIQENIKKLQTEIEESKQSIESQIQKSSTPREEVLRVILAPYTRTILSAQISTPILSSQVSAPVQKIFKRMGESFQKGDILIKIDDSVYGANLVKSLVTLDRARVLLQARGSLFDDAIASLIDLKDAQAAVASGEADVSLAQNQFDWSTIVAPYNGRVVTLNIEEYELPQPGQALIEIAEEERLLAKILVPSIYLKNIYIGKILHVNIQETGTTVEAKIIRIGAVIDPSSSTIAVDAEIDNRDGSLIPGMIGTTNIKSD